MLTQIAEQLTLLVNAVQSVFIATFRYYTIMPSDVITEIDDQTPLIERSKCEQCGVSLSEHVNGIYRDRYIVCSRNTKAILRLVSDDASNAIFRYNDSSVPIQAVARRPHDA